MMKRTAAGMTLIETLFVAAMFAFMMAALGTLFSDFFLQYKYQNASAGNAYAANLVIARTAALVLPADAVLSSHSFASGTYSTSATTLVLELPSIDASGAAVTSARDYAVVRLSSGSVILTVERSASSARHAGTETLATGVTALSFTLDSGDPTAATRVTTSVTTSTALRTGPVTTTLSGTAYLRNK